MLFGKKKFKLAAMIAGSIAVCSLLVGCAETGGGKLAFNDDEIVVGSNFEITGTQAQFGSNTAKGFRLAIKEINNAGGINGKIIKIVESDCKSDANSAAEVAAKLISEYKVVALVGPSVTENVIAASKVASNKKIPIIAPAATAPAVTVEDGEVKPFVFRSCFINPEQGEVMAEFAARDLNAKTAVIYLDNSSSYSMSLGKFFHEKFEQEGGQVVLEEFFLAKDQDFKAALTKIQTVNADVIFIPSYFAVAGKIIRQARELGIDSKILGTDGWDDLSIFEIAGKDALNDTFFCTHLFEADEEIRAFVETYSNEYKELPNAFAALGYDSGKMLIDAIKRGGTNPLKIRDSIETVKNLKVGTGVITMDAATHNPVKGVVIVENKDGGRLLRAKIAPEG